jgi:hypothetical protein
MVGFVVITIRQAESILDRGGTLNIDIDGQGRVASRPLGSLLPDDKTTV